MTRADAGSAASMAEALEQDPSDGGNTRCWKALARVIDEAPTYVWQEGDSNGITVACTILTGPFTGAEVTALVSGPLGGGLEVRPLRKGQRILLDLLDGRVDGLIVATAGVPGGKEDPIPSVIAGVPLTSTGLEEQGSAAANSADQPRGRLYAPPKGVGDREYYRGAIKVIRLKGKQDSFFSGFVVSGDDGASIEMRWNSLEQSYLTEIKDAQGARLSVGGGFASLFSPDGKTSVQVSNDGVYIGGKKVTVYGETCAQIDGGVVLLGMGVTPPTPVNACAVGLVGPANVISARVYVGLV